MLLDTPSLTRDKYGFGSTTVRFQPTGRSACLGADGDRCVVGAFGRVTPPLVHRPASVMSVNDVSRPASALGSLWSRPASACSSALDAQTPDVTRHTDAPVRHATPGGRVRPATAEFVHIQAQRRNAHRRIREVRQQARDAVAANVASHDAPASIFGITTTTITSAGRPSSSMRMRTVSPVPTEIPLASSAPKAARSATFLAGSTRSVPTNELSRGESQVQDFAGSTALPMPGFGFSNTQTRDALQASIARDAKQRNTKPKTATESAEWRLQLSQDALAGSFGCGPISGNPEVGARPGKRELIASLRRPQTYITGEHHLTGTLLTSSFNARVRAMQRADGKRTRSPTRVV
jgi:hypothetical protein